MPGGNSTSITPLVQPPQASMPKVDDHLSGHPFDPLDVELDKHCLSLSGFVVDL